MVPMPQPEEPTVLDELWLALPPGNPEHVAARLLDHRIMDAIEALVPPTRRPLVPWPHADAVSHLVAIAGWDGLQALYRRLDPTSRHELVVRATADLGADGTALWLEAAGDDTAAILARAWHHIGAAWGGRGKGDDEFAAATFTTNLEWARDLCERAVALDPDDPTPAVMAQRTWTDVDDLLRASQAWRGTHPFHLPGALGLVEGLARSGEEGLVKATARAIANPAPLGLPVASVVPTALAEMYRYRILHGIPPAEADAVFIEDSAWLVRAHQRWREGSPAPAWTDGQVRNTFAFALFFANLDGAAWQELQALDGHVTDYPWRLKSDDSVLAHQRARAWCVRHVEVGWTSRQVPGPGPRVGA